MSARISTSCAGTRVTMRATKACTAAPSFLRSERRAVAVKAAAADTASAETSTANDNKWYACVANAQFMLNDIQNESFAEQLREKTRFFKEKDMEIDFFLVCEPEWLDKQHPEAAKKVGRPCVALVGKSEQWIKYMKLRLDRVMYLEVEGTQDEIVKCGAAVPDFQRLDSKDNWVAPYPPYAPGWWNTFMPGRVDA